MPDALNSDPWSTFGPRDADVMQPRSAPREVNHTKPIPDQRTLFKLQRIMADTKDDLEHEDWDRACHNFARAYRLFHDYLKEWSK